MPFQSAVNYRAAPGVIGDFVSANPRWNVLGGPGGLVAGAAGVQIARFVWLDASLIDQDNAPTRVNNFGQGLPAGLVFRDMSAVNSSYLADSTMLVRAGQRVAVYNGGDMLVKNEGATYANIGMYAFANLLTGAILFAASGASFTATSSAASVAAGTSAFTGAIAGNVLTVSAVSSGTIYPGTTISGTNVATGTMIISQLSGTTGGIGTYAVSIAEQVVASTAISGTYGILTVGGTVAGTWGVGGLLAGTGTVAGTYVTAPITGTGGAGTYVVNNNTVVSSGALTVTTAIQTKWFAASAGAVGESIKLDSHSLG